MMESFNFFPLQYGIIWENEYPVSRTTEHNLAPGLSQLNLYWLRYEAGKYCTKNETLIKSIHLDIQVMTENVTK